MNSTRKTATNWLSAIGYRLSAIGYRLILGILLSVFSATAFAQDCKVNNPKISGQYVGACENGQAHGYGKATGIVNGNEESYEGEFRQGNMHGAGKHISALFNCEGQFSNDLMNGKGTCKLRKGAKFESNWLNGNPIGKGVMSWSNGTKYEGEIRDWQMNGFGILSVKGDIGQWEGQGKRQGDSYVVAGIFVNSKLAMECLSDQSCKQILANREAQERRDQATLRTQNNQIQTSNTGRGGLQDLVWLDGTKAHAVRCSNGSSDVIHKTAALGQYCGGSAADGYKCFSTPSLAAQHMCK